MFGAHLLNMKKNIFFLFATPQHVGNHTYHRRKKKLDADMFDAHLLNVKKIFFLLHQHVDTRHQVCKKLDADMFGAHLLNMKKNIFFVCHTTTCWQPHSPQTKKKLDADMFDAHLLNMKKIFFCYTNMLTPDTKCVKSWTPTCSVRTCST